MKKTAFLCLTAFAVAILVKNSSGVPAEKRVAEKRGQTDPVFPSGVRLTEVQNSDSNYNDPNNSGTPLFDKQGVESTYLSTNFRVREFTSKDGARYFRLSSCLVECLQRVRSQSGRSITINSGYRTVSHNAASGGGTTSRHLSGTAADIRFSSNHDSLTLAGSIVQECVALFGNQGQSIGIGLANSYIHIDHRPSFATWTYSGVTLPDYRWREWVQDRIRNSRPTLTPPPSAPPPTSSSAPPPTSSSAPPPTSSSAPPPTSSSAPPPTEDDGGLCFPASAVVHTDDPLFPVKQMADLHIGDRILSLAADGQLVYFPVVVFAYREPQKKAEFVQLQMEDGRQLQLTGLHLLFKNTSTQPLFASEIKLGDHLYTLDTTDDDPASLSLKPSRVTAISKVGSIGLFGPLTAEGTIIVDGVHTSCYGVLKDQQMTHAMFTPL